MSRQVFMKKLNLLFILCCIFLLGKEPVSGEIVKVNLLWQPETCQLQCPQMLAAQFQQIPGVAQIIMNPTVGSAEFRWKPTFPFIYREVKSAMQAVGPGIRDIRLKVRGTIQFSQQYVSLISLGDNTPFLLLGPNQPQPNQTSQYYSLQEHQLTPALMAQLVEGYQQGRIAIVEGPLFMPWRYSNYWLIIEKLQFVQSEYDQSSQQSIIQGQLQQQQQQQQVQQQPRY
jgi:hypothetical protein